MLKNLIARLSLRRWKRSLKMNIKDIHTLVHMLKNPQVIAMHGEHKWGQAGIGYAAHICCLNCGADINKPRGPCHLVAGNVGLVLGARLF